MASNETRECVRFGPYDPTNDTHHILHPESEDKMILVNSSQIPQSVKDYFQSTEGGKSAMPIPSTLAELIASLSPIAFGDNSALTDIRTAIEAYVDAELARLVVALHPTTGINVKANFRGYDSGTFPLLPNSSAVRTSEISVEIGTQFGAVSNIEWSSSDNNTKLRHLYIGLQDSYNDNTKNSFYDLMENMLPATASVSAQTNYGVELVSDLGALAPIEASQSLTTATLYLFGMDDINEAITAPATLTMKFRKPIFYWKYVVNEENGIGDTNIEGAGGYIANGTISEATNDSGWILTNGHSTKFIDGDITNTDFSYTLAGGSKAYLYVAVPYSPYYNNTVAGGSKFFTGTNSDGVSVYPGFNLANRIYDNSSRFAGGWSIVHNNYLVTLNTGHVDRYVIYRTDNVISAASSSSTVIKKFTLSDFE